MFPMHAMVRAAIESVATDDEGEFPSLGDQLGFSGENKARTVVRFAILAALRGLEDADCGHMLHYASGRWDRRNLRCLIEDLENSK